MLTRRIELIHTSPIKQVMTKYAKVLKNQLKGALSHWHSELLVLDLTRPYKLYSEKISRIRMQALKLSEDSSSLIGRAERTEWLIGHMAYIEPID